jgi:hypothetical protein
MSPPESALRIVAFADSDARVWGTAVDAGERAIVFGAGGGTGCAAGREAMAFVTRDGEWLLEGESFELTVTPADVGLTSADDGLTSVDKGLTSVDEGLTSAGEELCRVRGTVLVDGDRVSVDCPGTRTDESVAVDELESARGVWGWFGDRHALALLALRPRGRGEHEGDRLEATLFDPEETIAVQEPRLSTTYTAGGLPVRASLELWIADGDEQYPRRAAAEAIGAGAGVSAAGLALQVSPLRCHSRGLDGGGVYLLARF